MNITIPMLRTRHVNIGTSSATSEQAVPESAERVMRLPRLHVEVDERSAIAQRIPERAWKPFQPPMPAARPRPESRPNTARAKREATGGASASASVATASCG